jgi:hypothetical protein
LLNFPFRYKTNLHAFYVVHPTFWSRVSLTFDSNCRNGFWEGAGIVLLTLLKMGVLRKIKKTAFSHKKFN